MVDNVINFSKIKEAREQQTFDAIVEEMEKEDSNVEDIAVYIASLVVDEVQMQFESDITTDPKAIFDILAIIESIKALALRSMGREYYSQEFNTAMYSHMVKDPEKLLKHFMSVYED